MNNVILTTEQLSSIDHEISQLIQQDSTILLNETIDDIRKLIVDMLRKDLSSNWYSCICSLLYLYMFYLN